MKTDLILDTIEIAKEQVLADFRLVSESRHVSLLTRKEVFMGKAKFGVTGDGKELAQIAMARAFKAGDFRSGYYRDMTFVAAVGDVTWEQFFSQLYGHTDTAFDPHAGGRMMNAHFATRLLDEQGHWTNQLLTKNSIGDISPTAGQIPRAVGLGYASKLYRENPQLTHNQAGFSEGGNEVCFATIGDASTSQGMFFETINAAGVLQVPVIFSVWDDGYGISVPTKYQTTKESISKILMGFQRNEYEKGLEIITVKGWDYPALLEAYQYAAYLARTEHIPSVIHVEECVQLQGHSTSGSHERYKPEERLAWEREWDCNRKFREWILVNGYATNDELDEIDAEAYQVAKKARDFAYKAYREFLGKDSESVIKLLQDVARQTRNADEILKILKELQASVNPESCNAHVAVKQALRVLRLEDTKAKKSLQTWLAEARKRTAYRYSSYLYSQSDESSLRVKPITAQYEADALAIDGREILNKGFDAILERDPRVFIIGEDVGQIGDVNQTLNGLQKKYGEYRLTDTGIRETTIIGQGIGAAIRGLRPIVEIQYLDYILYPFATLSDDLACLHYRTVGGQKAPLIVRTRGHRLEGVWHSGSPIGLILDGLRGMMVCTPRNMTQAVGMYNTLLKSDDPALVIECLNGYRQKEKLPNNLAEICVPMGMPEVLREGTDITIVTYGSMCRIVMAAAEDLQKIGISIEVIDVQTLLPFDLEHRIVASIQKTNRLIIADEDMPGGASAFILHKIIDEQEAFKYLDASPRTLTSYPHRPAFGSDGDYFSKPNEDDVFDWAYEVMNEADPRRFPKIY